MIFRINTLSVCPARILRAQKTCHNFVRLESSQGPKNFLELPKGPEPDSHPIQRNPYHEGIYRERYPRYVQATNPDGRWVELTSTGLPIPAGSFAEGQAKMNRFYNIWLAFTLSVWLITTYVAVTKYDLWFTRYFPICVGISKYPKLDVNMDGMVYEHYYDVLHEDKIVDVTGDKGNKRVVESAE